MLKDATNAELFYPSKPVKFGLNFLGEFRVESEVKLGFFGLWFPAHNLIIVPVSASLSQVVASATIFISRLATKNL